MDRRLEEILNYYGGSINADDSISIHCPTPGHTDKSPSCKVSLTQHDKPWASCFSQCKGTKDAQEALKSDFPDMFKSSGGGIIKKADVASLLSEVPAGYPAAPDSTPAKNSRLVSIYAYCDKNGNETGLRVYRYMDSKDTKQIMPCRAAKAKDGRHGWAWTWGGDVPLYGLEQLAKPGATGKPVVIVEGEKCVNKAREIYGDKYVFLSWAQGSSQWGRVDWSQIDWNPPCVYIWPDNDTPGKKWAIDGDHKTKPLYKILTDLGHKVLYVDVFKTKGLARGWDIADAIAESREVHKILEGAANPVGVVTEAIYDRCPAAKEIKLIDEALSEFSCGDSQECDGCTHLHNTLISHPSDISKYTGTPFMIDWIYLKSEDCMYRLKDRAIHPLIGFNHQYQHITCTMDEPQSASSIYLDNPDAIQADNLTFIPGSGRVIEHNGEYLLNYWKPASVAATADPRGLELWTKLLMHLVPEEADRNHLLDWMAFTLQYPEKKINWQVLMCSPMQGVGKDSLFMPLSNYFASHSGNVSPYQMAERFTGYLENKKFLMVQELEGVSGKTLENRLKPLCATQSRPTLSVEKKGKDPYEIPNLVSIVAMSNERVPVKLKDANDRRWLVLKFPGKGLEPEFYNEYYTLMAQGQEIINYENTTLTAGATAVIALLMNREVDAGKMRGNAPMTQAKEELAADSKPVSSEIVEMIEDGDAIFEKDVVLLSEVSIRLRQLDDFRRFSDRAMKGILSTLDVLKKWSEADQGRVRVPEELRIKYSYKNLNMKECPLIVRNHLRWLNMSKEDVLKEALETKIHSRDFR